MASLLFPVIALPGTPRPATAPEPRWHQPAWQIPLVQWLKTLTAADIHTEAAPIRLPELSETEARRLFQVAQGAGPLASFMTTSAALPDGDFLWPSIWRTSLPLAQAFLKDTSHGLTTGQWWLPSHPTTANFLALAWSLDEPWNPYRGNPAIARRAAVISVVDLLAQAENVFYYSDPASSKPGVRYGFAHPGQMGFTLTFSAFTLLKTREALPAEVVKSWSDGLEWLARGTAAVKPMGPQNMRLSLPVAFHYSAVATGRPIFQELRDAWKEKVMFGPELSPAGHYWEGQNRSPDGSYNGIGLHRVAEYWALTRDERVLDLLRRAYRLKGCLTLVEPDGTLLGATHFNDRDTASFANDQFGGREIMFALEVPDAIPFLVRNRGVWPQIIDVFRVRHAITNAHIRLSPRILPAHGWGLAAKYHDAPHQWGMVATLPYFLYQEDKKAQEKAVAADPGFPITTRTHYTEDFNHEFFVVRRPGYHATLYTGRVTVSDKGGTNLGGWLAGAGGNFNGFGGGGLSTFWTPASGTLLIGRHCAAEGYERGTKPRFIPGWQDWANHHIIGKTLDGKILTSARVHQPTFERRTNAVSDTVIVGGTMPNRLPLQGVICDANVSYRRRFDFLPSCLEIATELTTDRPIAFQALYETLPVMVASNTSMAFLDGRGATLSTSSVDRVQGVKELLVRREPGGVRIAFAEPVTVALVSEAFDTHRPPVKVRALQVEYPTRLATNVPALMRYTLIPYANGTNP